MKRLLVLLLLAATLRAADDNSIATISSEEIASPAAPGAVGASLAQAPDGTLWLSWVQSARGQPNAIRFATLDGDAKKWSTPRTLAAETSVTTNPMDFPQLAVDTRGNATAIWTDGHGGARLSRSTDRGATWSAPEAFAPDGHEVEKFSLAVLADGRVLAAWLDGRGKKSGSKMQQLYARVLAPGATEALVDAAVCDCCQTTLTAFPDGGALLAYRGRTAEEVRDIRVARFLGKSWDEPRPLSNDDWRINACPVNGPRLHNDRGRVAAAWFTAADNDPRALISYSPDAGTRFLQPLRIDRGQPIGHVDTAILSDGAILVTWVEKNGSLWLRRVSPDFSGDEPVALAPSRVSSYPRFALLRDHTGAQTRAQIAVAYIRDDKPATLHTLLVSVPEGELLTQNKNCDCAPTAEQLRGLPIRGTIVAVESGALSVRHGEIPGMLPAGTHRFQATPETLAAAVTGREMLARVDSRESAWVIFDVRLLAAAR